MNSCANFHDYFPKKAFTDWCKSNMAPIWCYLVLHIRCIQPVSMHHPAIISYRSVVIRMVGCTICASNQDAWGPCHQWYFLHNANLMRMSFCFFPNTDRIIAAKRCTCHDSCAVVACAKLWGEMMTRNENTVIEIFYWKWIEKSWVKWVFRPHWKLPQEGNSKYCKSLPVVSVIVSGNVHGCLVGWADVTLVGIPPTPFAWLI